MTSLNSRRMPADPGHETEAGSSETSRLSNLGIGLLLLGVLLPQINYFGVNVALNTIRRSLGASPADLDLIVAGYGTAYAIFLVIGGRLGDRYGRRRVFTIGLIGFLVASLGCGLAPSAILLVVFRILQGALGAATITVERRAERRGLVSLLPPSVLGLSSVRRGLSLHLPFMLGYGAFMFVLDLVLQQGLHADPLTAGWPRCRWQCRSSSPRRGARRPDRDPLAPVGARRHAHHGAEPRGHRHRAGAGVRLAVLAHPRRGTRAPRRHGQRRPGHRAASRAGTRRRDPRHPVHRPELPRYRGAFAITTGIQVLIAAAIAIGARALP